MLPDVEFLIEPTCIVVFGCTPLLGSDAEDIRSTSCIVNGSMRLLLLTRTCSSNCPT